jgi:hypothetical protein
MAVLKDTPSARRKSILAALVVLTNNDKYRPLMKSDSELYEREINENKKSDKQIKNWVTQQEIKNKLGQMKKVSEIYWKLPNITMEHIQFIQNYVLLCLMSGQFVLPRRSMDWAEMKIRNYDRREVGGTDNFFNGRHFIFNKFKTVKTFDSQKIDCPSALQKILKKWIPLIARNCDYLLFDYNGAKLSPIKIAQRLNKIFGKNVSVNILRHSFISEQYKEKTLSELSVNEIQNNATKMGHSMNTHLQYIKKE